jgi:hypothetical protein
MKRVYKCDLCKRIVDEEDMRQLGSATTFFEKLTAKKICTQCMNKRVDEI